MHIIRSASLVRIQKENLRPLVKIPLLQQPKPLPQESGFGCTPLNIIVYKLVVTAYSLLLV